MRDSYSIKSGNYMFVLEFSFSEKYELRPETSGLEIRKDYKSGIEESKYLEVLIYRKDCSGINYHSRHITGGEIPIHFDINYPDGHNINGELSLFQSKDSGRHIVYVSAHCGPSTNQLHFSGTVSALP